MWSQRLYEWQVKCREKSRKNRLAVASAVIACTKIIEKNNIEQNKKYWVHPLWQLRNEHGFYHAIFPVVSLEESQMRNYFRMTMTQFEALLSKVGGSIAKQTCIRQPISPGERLSLTLRFLATGDSMDSSTYSYLVGKTTASSIVGETCQAIWDCLQEEVLPSTLSQNEWLKIAKDFETIWNFPHCCGAIDGKHIAIQSPNNAGSEYYNYKGFHSIVLLAVCDANYLFRFVDIGACGRRCDSGIYNFSTFGQSFNSQDMNMPAPVPLSPGSMECSYVIVGDEAFPLKNYLMRPYPGRGGLSQEKNIYNYRLSRARRTIENAFGLMVCQWRILKRPIIASKVKSRQIIQAITCLHNYLRIPDIGIDEYGPESMLDQDERVASPTNITAFQDVTKFSTNYASEDAKKIRSEYCRYFNQEGAVPRQYDHC